MNNTGSINDLIKYVISNQKYNVKSQADPNSPEVKAKEFNDWSNNQDNYNAAMTDQDVPLFDMMGSSFDISKYSSQLNNFSQACIDMYDSNEDSNWSFDEFAAFVNGDKETKVEPNSVEEQLYSKLLDNLNLDDDKEHISSQELASMLYLCDIDIDNYLETGDFTSSLDGKLDYNQYNLMSGAPLVEGNEDITEFSKAERKNFHQYFYGQD